MKQDLEKIDLLIDQDVLILRSKIDALAVDVSQAHTQMVKKEKEYTQAKQLYDKRFNEKVYLSLSLSLLLTSLTFLPPSPPHIPSPSLSLSLSPYTNHVLFFSFLFFSYTENADRPPEPDHFWEREEERT